MSVVEIKCLCIECDACNKLFASDVTDKPTQKELEDLAYKVDGWLTIKGKHYCDKCWRYDNKGHIIAKDGSIYDAETGRFIGYEREDY